MKSMNSIGCVHGRFQPFHLGHLEYVMAAAKQCSRLIIGITQFDIRALSSSDEQHRSEMTSNPLSYAERCELISVTLLAQGINRGSFEFVPFPIEKHTLIPDFVSPKAIFFTTVYEKWNLTKIQKLKELGLDVRVLWERESKIFSGQKVRQSIIEGNDDWKSMVHESVVSLLEEWRIRDRLTQLAFDNNSTPAINKFADGSLAVVN